MALDIELNNFDYAIANKVEDFWNKNRRKPICLLVSNDWFLRVVNYRSELEFPVEKIYTDVNDFRRDFPEGKEYRGMRFVCPKLLGITYSNIQIGYDDFYLLDEVPNINEKLSQTGNYDLIYHYKENNK